MELSDIISTQQFWQVSSLNLLSLVTIPIGLLELVMILDYGIILGVGNLWPKLLLWTSSLQKVSMLNLLFQIS